MTQTSTPLQRQALLDALSTARGHVWRERAALQLCVQHGWTREARVARTEIAAHGRVVAKLVAKLHRMRAAGR